MTHILLFRRHLLGGVAASALMLALGLATLGLAPNLWWYLGAWVILGLGMSGGACQIK